MPEDFLTKIKHDAIKRKKTFSWLPSGSNSASGGSKPKFMKHFECYTNTTSSYARALYKLRKTEPAIHPEDSANLNYT